MSDPPRKPDLRVRDQRARVETALDEVRGALKSEVGMTPRRRWLLPLAASGVGVLLGLSLRRALRKLLAARGTGG